MIKRIICAYLILLACFVVSPASAEPISTTDPVSSDVPTPDFKFYNIYARTFDYRQEQIKLSEQLANRQKEFLAPSLKSYNAYKNERENLYKSDKESAHEEEIFGPPGLNQ